MEGWGNTPIERSEGAPCPYHNKSLEAAAQLALYYKRRPKNQWKPAWVITEPHLVDELAGTIRSAYPGAFVDVVTDLAEVIAFLGLESDPTLGCLPRVAVLSKEAFKNGSGAEPAVTVDYRRLHNVTDEEGNPLPAFRCPDCGRLQVISHDCNLGPAGRLVTDIAYFHRPRRCCYDVIDTEDGRVIRMGCSRPEHYEPWEADRSGSCGYLYQQARSIGRTGIYEGQGQDGFERVDGIARGELDPRRLTPARPGLARMPIADYLSQLHPDQVGLVIWDEAHTAKGQSTDAGHALAAIAQVADHILLMTGTLFGGKASSVFHLAHRINPAFRRRWRWDQLQTFVERYGVLERKTIEKEYEEISDRGTTTTKTRRNTYVRELAGCSPALVSLFLSFTIFTGLGDLGISLPRLSRRLIHAPPDEDHQLLYDRYREVCVETLQDAKEADVDLGGSLLHTLRGVAVSPWRPEYLKRKIVKPVNGRMRHTRTRIYASANSLDWRCAGCGRSLPNYGHLGSPNRLRCHHCYPGNAEGSAAWKEALGGHRPLITHQNGRLFSAEQALIDELLAQKERDRRCLVFVCQTDTRDITPRLIELCRRHGLEALRCDVPPRKRGAWFEKYAPYADVVFVNPEACKTGLNLTMFSTVIWFEIPYSLYTLKQAAARVRRPTSTADVIEEIYVNVPGTIVEDALALVFDKMTAAAIFRGESAEQALQVIKGTGNMTADLIARVAERAKDRADDLEALFARYNREDEASEGSGEPAEPLATSVEDSQAERARQMAEEARKLADKLVTLDATFGDDNAIEAAGQASVQMSLFS